MPVVPRSLLFVWLLLELPALPPVPRLVLVPVALLPPVLVPVALLPVLPPVPSRPDVGTRSLPVVEGESVPGCVERSVCVLGVVPGVG